jgi:hypothetical protein
MHENSNHRLSSIEMLSEAATADIQWAINTLDEGRRSDSDILFEFNDRLAVIGEGPISKSAFGRYALRKRKIFGARTDFLMMSRAFKKENSAQNIDAQTELLTDMLMTAIFMYSSGKQMAPKEILDMSRAMTALNSAKRISTGEKSKADKGILSKVDAVFSAATTAMEATATNPEDGKAYLKRIREEVYNIFDEAPDKSQHQDALPPSVQPDLPDAETS